MPIKWVQCRICGHTKNIDYFPEPHRKRLQKTGSGECKECFGFLPIAMIVSTPLDRFFDFMEAQNDPSK